MKRKSDKVSLGEIARRAGVSPSAACFALQNQPGVSVATRERVIRIARELGYTPDARIGDWMARVRGAKSKDMLPIAWLNSAWSENEWQHYPFLSPFLDGARARAAHLGYKIEEFWCRAPGTTMRGLSRILYQRGIEGVIATFPARHLQMDWSRWAGVALGASLLAPRLHRVTADVNFNIHLALKAVSRLGYRRIGICLAHEVDTASHYSIRAVARDLYSKAPPKERVPPLFHRLCWRQGGNHDERGEEVGKWLKRYKPDVIIGHDNHLVQWAEAAGFRVPEDVGIAHLAVDDDVLDWAGIYSERRKMGATVVDWLVSLMRNREYGVPESPLNILMRGRWQSGRTLRSPGSVTPKSRSLQWAADSAGLSSR